jgi:hypothetical protein
MNTSSFFYKFTSLTQQKYFCRLSTQAVTTATMADAATFALAQSARARRAGHCRKTRLLAPSKVDERRSRAGTTESTSLSTNVSLPMSIKA